MGVGAINGMMMLLFSLCCFGVGYYNSCISIGQVSAFAIPRTSRIAQTTTTTTTTRHFTQCFVALDDHVSTTTGDSNKNDCNNIIQLDVLASRGLSQDELSLIFETINNEKCVISGIMIDEDELLQYDDDDDDDISFQCNINNNVSCTSESPCPSSIPGSLGRILLLETTTIHDPEIINTLQSTISQQMDQLVMPIGTDHKGEEEEEGKSDTDTTTHRHLKQPFLLVIQDSSTLKQQVFGTTIDESNVDEILASLLQEQVDMYGMLDPIYSSSSHKDPEGGDEMSPPVKPTIHVEIDGAQVKSTDGKNEWWDTSTVLVFDDLVDEDLRKRLLNVVLGPNSSKNWDDINNGPDPKRWIRGGLLDIPEGEEAVAQQQQADSSNDDDNDAHSSAACSSSSSTSTSTSDCWGLRDEVIEELCYERHTAIEEFESVLSSRVFPQYHITRLSESVYGSSVSPLTANAPIFGDTFNYHVDGDPNVTPPSPWTDIYGRYPNRMVGKPRFVSCLLYLNDEWNGNEWGAPTRFLDPPTDTYYEVYPKPGRCVIMDQDCSHTVVAPNESAGEKRPRYSLVWKLVLHPKLEGQYMNDLENGRNWEKPILFGSAKK